MQIYDYVLKVDVVRLRPHDQESLKRIRQIREEEPRWNLAIDKYPFVDALASTDVSSAICCTCRLAYQESTDTLYSNKLFIPFQYIPAFQCNFLPEIGRLNARNIRELSIGLTQDDALRPWFSQGMCPLFDFPVRIKYRRNNRPKRLSHSIIALLNTMYPLSKSSLSLLCTEADGGDEGILAHLRFSVEENGTNPLPRTPYDNVKDEIRVVQDAFPRLSLINFSPGQTVSIEEAIKKGSEK